MNYKEYMWAKALDLVFDFILKPLKGTKDTCIENLNFEKTLKDFKSFFELPSYTRQIFNDVEDFIKEKTMDIEHLDLFFRLFFYNLLMTDEYNDKIYKFYNSNEHDRMMQGIDHSNELAESNNEMLKTLVHNSEQFTTVNNTPIENKKQIIDQKDFFIDLWYETLFLHKDPQYESICLKDTYLVPNYI